MNDIIVYGTKWCIDCVRARNFLQKHKINFIWIDIDDNKDAEEFVVKVNNGNRSVPTIIFSDGTILTEPSNYELAHKLKLKK